MQVTNSLSRPSPTFKLDLSRAGLIEVVDAFVAYKRKSNTEYKSTTVRSVLLKAQEAFGCTPWLPPAEHIRPLSRSTVLIPENRSHAG